MRSNAMILAAAFLLISVKALSQEQGQVRPAEAPATDTVAKDVPGVRY